MRLILVRHGETLENKAGILQGQTQGHLSELGIEQAKKLAKRLKDEKIDAIYCSDLKRTKDTAKEIIKYHLKTPVRYVKELRERNCGCFEGKNRSEWDKVKHNDEFLKSKGVETKRQVYDRTKKFLESILHEHKNDTVIFVSHGVFNRTIFCVILGKRIEDIDNVERYHNASMSIFEITENGNHKIHLLNCTKHLE